MVATGIDGAPRVDSTRTDKCKVGLRIPFASIGTHLEPCDLVMHGLDEFFIMSSELYSSPTSGLTSALSFNHLLHDIDRLNAERRLTKNPVRKSSWTSHGSMMPLQKSSFINYYLFRTIYFNQKTLTQVRGLNDKMCHLSRVRINV